jgi:hypothetical protein
MGLSSAGPTSWDKRTERFGGRASPGRGWLRGLRMPRGFAVVREGEKRISIRLYGSGIRPVDAQEMGRIGNPSVKYRRESEKRGCGWIARSVTFPGRRYDLCFVPLRMDCQSVLRRFFCNAGVHSALRGNGNIEPRPGRYKGGGQRERRPIVRSGRFPYNCTASGLRTKWLRGARLPLLRRSEDVRRCFVLVRRS